MPIWAPNLGANLMGAAGRASNSIRPGFASSSSGISNGYDGYFLSDEPVPMLQVAIFLFPFCFFTSAASPWDVWGRPGLTLTVFRKETKVEQKHAARSS